MINLQHILKVLLTIDGRGMAAKKEALKELVNNGSWTDPEKEHLCKAIDDFKR